MRLSYFPPSGGVTRAVNPRVFLWQRSLSSLAVRVIFSRFLQRQELDRQEMLVVSRQPGQILQTHKRVDCGTRVVAEFGETL